MIKYIKDWEYRHNQPIPDLYKNHWIYYTDDVGIHTHKILLNANPNTFEYRGKSTSVVIQPDSYHGDYWILMSTIDDSSLNLRLRNISLQDHMAIMGYFKDLYVTSCYDTYIDLASLLDLPPAEVLLGNWKEIAPSTRVVDLGFN